MLERPGCHSDVFLRTSLDILFKVVVKIYALFDQADKPKYRMIEFALPSGVDFLGQSQSLFILFATRSSLSFGLAPI